MNRLFSIDSKRDKNWMLAKCLLGFLSALLVAGPISAETGDHQLAYIEALQTVKASELRIRQGMERISSGEVAHYDFLQHEHIELLRHARALRHPPSGVSAENRGEIVARADALLLAADSLEWVIADFLRAHAVLQSALSNTVDLVAIQMSQGVAGGNLDQLRALTDAANVVRANNTPETLALLDAAFEQVLALDGGLLIQRQLILGNSGGFARAVEELAEAEITPLAAALDVTFLGG